MMHDLAQSGFKWNIHCLPV